MGRRLRGNIMICVICNTNDVSNSSDFDRDFKQVTCPECRVNNYPSHMKHTQYERYWVTFTNKWRKENKYDEKEKIERRS